ncbi:MAG TPA: FHA domain-containing protein [Polyangiaceae bacterium LLY-WYZ-15_(1-7)]|nr:FHA domain-containing protein [Polyangiaceae bacterium LLY-WYZ-15_(1-7)]HJL11717.1 FHA domain-containing protein [Polyangiaceae bacterium LLY-WYZ-15_(1-7)]HJL39381.1 FHA domain-containing protein [Polyangiaceae bacterium LLY-WYZ-15_(1-7)]
MSRSISNIVVGRSRDCDLVLKDPTVSGRHARLAWEGDKILLEDLGSANGTFVGGKRITREHIRPGDEVRFGRAPLRWSESALRPFLRKGGKDTILGESIPGRRFICGSCGTRGVMPPGFKGGVLRCGACGQRLIVSQPGPRWPRFVMTSLALAAAAALLIWVVRGVETNPIREAAERLGLPDPGSTAASSPQEASIRIHTLDRVVAAIDTSVPATRNAAVQIAAQDEGPFRVEQVARVWSHVRSEWRYVNDPRGDEYFATASESIENGYVGDCDDFAIVLVAMLQAIGGDARLVMMDGPQGGHAYAEVCLPEDSDTVRDRLSRHYRRNPDRNLGRQRVSAIHFRPGHECPVWLNLDWNAGVPGGAYEPEQWAVAIYPDGRTETLAPAGSAPMEQASRGEAASAMVAAPPE